MIISRKLSSWEDLTAFYFRRIIFLSAVLISVPIESNVRT